MVGGGLSKAGVDKDPVIWHSHVKPKFRPYFEIAEYCIFGRSYLIYGKKLFSIFWKRLQLNKANTSDNKPCF